jgi:hypothetical protein
MAVDQELVDAAICEAFKRGRRVVASVCVTPISAPLAHAAAA